MIRIPYLRRLRTLSILTLLTAVLSPGASATAANQTWFGFGPDNNWATPGNWASNVAPSASDSLTFAGFQDISPVNNYAANTQFNGISFDAAAGNFSVSGNSINLAGNVSDSSLNAETVALNLTLQATPTISAATINSSLTLSGSLSGAAGITVTGNGLVILSHANGFTGPVTINGGVLSISSDTFLGAVPGAVTPGSIVIDGGALRSTGATTLSPSRGITLGDAAPGTGGIFDAPAVTNNFTYVGTIANASGGTNSLTKKGLGTLTLGGPNTYTGNTIVNQGQLTLNFSQTAAPLSNIINSASGLVMGGNPSNLGTANNTPASISASAIKLQVTGSNGKSNAQSFNGLTLNPGYETVTTTPGNTGGQVLLALGPITANPGGIVSFSPGGTLAAGANAITTTTPNDASGILGGWAIAGGAGYAANDGLGDIVSYAGYAPVGGGGSIVSAGTTNVQITSAGAVTGAVGQTVDINTLSLGTAATTTATTVTNDAAGVLRLGAKGGLALFGSAGTLTVSGGSITAGGADNAAGMINIFNGVTSGGSPAVPGGSPISVLTINSAITDNGSGTVGVAFAGIQKANAGAAVLGGTNSYSGGTFIPAGFVVGTNAKAFGTGPITVYNGGQAYFNLASPDTITNNFFIAGNGAATNASATCSPGAINVNGGTLSGTITLNGESGIMSTGAASVTAISGQISGTGNLTLGNAQAESVGFPNELPSGTIILSNTNNNWSGDLIIANKFFGAGVNGLPNYPQTLGTVQMGNANVIPHGSGAGNVYMLATASSPYSSAAAWVLNGYNQTINGLGTVAGSGGTISTVSNGSSTTPATLSLGDGDASAAFAGQLIDGGAATLALTKIGNGTQILSGTNTFTGPITVQGGILNLTAPNATGGMTTITGGELLLSGTGSVNNAASIVLNGSGAKLVNISTVTLTPNISVTQGLVDGYGTLGAVTVASGTGNTVTNGFAATTTNSLTIGSLSFGGSAAINVNDSGTDTTPGILVTGALDTNAAGKIIVGAAASSWPNDTYDLIGFGSLTGAGSSVFTKGAISGLNSWQSATLGEAGGFITLTVTGPSLVWTGSDNSNWKVGSTGPNHNWKLSGGSLSGTPVDALGNDAVVFDDTAVTSAVNISTANIRTSSVTFSNNSLNYTISSGSGFGIISGSLTKGGTGTVTINTANSYVGGTTLSAGVLVLGNSAALGSVASSLTVNGGTLDLHGFNPTTGAFGGGGGVIASNGGQAGTLSVNVAGTSTYSGTLADNTDSLGGTLSFNKSGTGTLLLANPNTLSGPTTISFGAIQLGDPNSLQNSNVTVNSANGLTFAAAAGGNFNIAGLSGNGGITLTDTGSNGVTLNVGANNFSTTYSGALTGLGGLNKVGSGSLTLAGNAVGTLTVSSGSLQVSNAGMPTATIQAGATLWVSATNNSGGGVLYGGALVGSGTVLVTEWGVAGASTGFDTDFSSFGGLLDLLPNPTSGQGAFQLAAAAAEPLPSAIIKIEPNTSLELASGLIDCFNAFQLSGTGTSDKLGALRLDGDHFGAAEIDGPITLLTNSSIGNNSANTAAITGNINESGGSFSLAKLGGGRIVLSGTNTYTGGTIISAGTLQLANQDHSASYQMALPVGPVTVNGGLDLNGYSASVTTLTGSGTIDDTSTSGGSTTLTVSAGTFTGNLQNTGFSESLTLSKVGSATLVLSGNGSYSGGTFVGGGTLMVTNPAAILDGSSLTVGNAAAFESPVVPSSAEASEAVAPVPEPSALILAAAGTALMYLGRRRLRHGNATRRAGAVSGNKPTAGLHVD